MTKWGDFEVHPMGTTDRIEKLEAKLAKAVTFAEIVERCGHGALWPLALDHIKELKGEKP